MSARDGSGAPPLAGLAGFSLIEVLVAMVLLAIGLCGVQLLGVTAGGMLATAERRTQLIGVATRHLDAAVDSAHLRRLSCGSAEWLIASSALRVSRTVHRVSPAGLAVAVRVRRVSPGGTPHDTLSLSAHVLRPDSTGC